MIWFTNSSREKNSKNKKVLWVPRRSGNCKNAVFFTLSLIFFPISSLAGSSVFAHSILIHELLSRWCKPSSAGACSLLTWIFWNYSHLRYLIYLPSFYFSFYFSFLVSPILESVLKKWNCPILLSSSNGVMSM